MGLRWLCGLFGKTDTYIEGRHREIIDPPIALQSHVESHGDQPRFPSRRGTYCSLEYVSKMRHVQFRADWAAFQGDFPQA